MTHSESLARQVVDAAAEAVFNEPRHRDEIGPQYRHDAKAAAAAVLEVLAREHRAGLMPYNPGAYLQQLIDKVREGRCP